MIEHTITFFEPESKKECDGMDCEDCHRMQLTIIGEKMPVCFNHTKSEFHLGMTA